MEKSKSTIVSIIILFVVIIGLVGYIYYREQEYAELEKQVESKEEKTVENKHTYEQGYHVYYNHGIAQIIGYKGELYIVESLENMEACVKELTNGDKNITFDSNNNYKCNVKDEFGLSIITKMNLKEEEVSKVVIQHVPSMSDPSYIIFVIYPDGKVQRYANGTTVPVKELENYDIIDIKEYACETGMKETCKNPYLAVVLRDNSEKRIEYHEGP